MRQRVMIAMALALGPKLLIADEPTTALDVTIQAQVIDLIRELAAPTGTAVLLITHDLGVVADMTQRTCVMYAGFIVETATTAELFADPVTPIRSDCCTRSRASMPRARPSCDPIEGAPGADPAAGRLPVRAALCLAAGSCWTDNPAARARRTP